MLTCEVWGKINSERIIVLNPKDGPAPFDPSKVIKPEDPDALQEKRGSFSGGKMS